MSMFTLSLLFMSWAKTGEYAIIAERAPKVAIAAIEATREVGSLFDGASGESETMELLMRIAYLESRGDFHAVSLDGAVGIVQIQSPSKADAARILSSATEGMIFGLQMLHAAKKACGGKAIDWIGAYASGRCGGAPSIARERCGPLGLCARVDSAPFMAINSDA